MARKKAEARASGRPRWDGERRELWVGKFLVKGFRRPAPNQEAILAAFEELGWPARIDDPITGEHGRDPRQRLHEAIKSLNRNQMHRLIHFEGDGTGEGIRWTLI
ncbi:MAG TPA: hypothetical protein VG013_07925 [Gemmataceae bacterium]|nr:hypothetical protein [Gemmataceae bacterium]